MAIPVIVEPIQVQVTLRVVPVEVRHVAVAIHLRNGALCEMPSAATTSRPPRADKRLNFMRDLISSLGTSHQLSLIF